MDFFQRQDKARSQTVLLVLLFIVGLFLTAFLIHCVVIGVVSITADSHKDDFVYHLLNQPGLLLLDLLLVSLFVTLVALGKIVQLNKEGPDGIALSLGGKTVPRGSSDPREQRLYNVVEEIALAAGTPVPRVYIMYDEPSINACAIGTSPENAAVCVTRGTMDYLTRDELQGVIAH
ncbi:MAG: M48 family metalloprotease, partial [Thermoguttaceae bacterium]|nr:M48 family metalloprotease [Thermoguttaceae bacterium]